MRTTQFAQDNFYHIYNRGVDKRSIFTDEEDLKRFLRCMDEFNVIDPIGSLRDKQKKEIVTGFPRNLVPGKLVNLVAFCVNQNHYHFILEPIIDNGIQKFMHKLSLGYTNYFNEKHKRTGSLFQGTYKAIHITTDEYLLHLSAYVNLNDRVHKDLNKDWMNKYQISSFSQYTGEEKTKSPIRCAKDIVLGQFPNKKAYEKFALSSLKDIVKRKEEKRELNGMLLE